MSQMWTHTQTEKDVNPIVDTRLDSQKQPFGCFYIFEDERFMVWKYQLSYPLIGGFSSSDYKIIPALIRVEEIFNWGEE